MTILRRIRRDLKHKRNRLATMFAKRRPSARRHAMKLEQLEPRLLLSGDVRGRLVGSYVNQMQGAGSHTLHLPLSSFTTGAYVQVFEAGSTIQKDRIMVVK